MNIKKQSIKKLLTVKRVKVKRTDKDYNSPRSKYHAESLIIVYDNE